MDLSFSHVSKFHSVQDVVFNTSWEEDWFLLHESNLVLVVPRVVQILYVFLREEHFAFFRVIKALDEWHNWRFSTARLSYQSDDLVLLNINWHFFEHCDIRFWWIAELNIFKVDVVILLCAALDLNLVFFRSKCALTEYRARRDDKYSDLITWSEYLCNGLNVVH